MLYHRIMFERPKYTIKVHMVREDMLEALKADMMTVDTTHIMDPLGTGPATKYYWDIGGMAMMERSYEMIQLSDGVSIEVPSQDFEHFIRYLNELYELGPRVFGIGYEPHLYYKLHYMSCLVLDATIFEELIVKAKALIESAKTKGRSDDAKFSAAILKAQAAGYLGHVDRQQRLIASQPLSGVVTGIKQ